MTANQLNASFVRSDWTQKSTLWKIWRSFMSHRPYSPDLSPCDIYSRPLRPPKIMFLSYHHSEWKKMLRAYANRADLEGEYFRKVICTTFFPTFLIEFWDFSEDLVYHPRTTRIILASYLITYFYILKIYPKPQRRIRSANTFVLLLWKSFWAHSTFVLPWRCYGLRSVNNITKSLI